MTDFVLNPAEVGARIRAIRDRQNKTQAYFADMLFISPSYLSLIEDGKRVPTLDVFIQIAKFCDVSLDYLIFGEDKDMNQELQIFRRLQDTYPTHQMQQAMRMAEYFLMTINVDEEDELL